MTLMRRPARVGRASEPCLPMSLMRRKDASRAAEECSGVERYQAGHELSRLSQPSTPRLGPASLAGEARARLEPPGGR
jgi:hypothetical protein